MCWLSFLSPRSAFQRTARYIPAGMRKAGYCLQTTPALNGQTRSGRPPARLQTRHTVKRGRRTTVPLPSTMSRKVPAGILLQRTRCNLSHRRRPTYDKSPSPRGQGKAAEKTVIGLLPWRCAARGARRRRRAAAPAVRRGRPARQTPTGAGPPAGIRSMPAWTTAKHDSLPAPQFSE